MNLRSISQRTKKVSLFFAFSSLLTLSVFAMKEGMWSPWQFNQEELQKRLIEEGIEIDPRLLSDPTSFPLNSIIHIGSTNRGFCSASFVSPEGLIITNHHCTVPYLNAVSATDLAHRKVNLVVTGFTAKNRQEELPVNNSQIQAAIYVTESFVDVTEEVQLRLSEIMTPVQRAEAIREAKENLEDSCEAELSEDYRCEAADFFGGEVFYLIQKRMIKDVRLVHSPAENVGAFGGFDDNWRWPRQAADYSLLRAYVAPDGSSADFAKENIPYNSSETFLRVASEAHQDGDFAMVVGYPGNTNALRTAAEFREAAVWNFPRDVEVRRNIVEILQEETSGDALARLNVQNRINGLINYQQKNEASFNNMINYKVVSERDQLELEVRRWVESSPERMARYQNVFNEIETALAQRRPHRNKDRAFRELTSTYFSTGYFEAANHLRSAIEARSNENVAQEAGAIKSLEEFYSTYHRDLERALLEYQLSRMAKFSEQDQPETFKWMVNKALQQQNLDELREKDLVRSIVDMFFDESILDQDQIVLAYAKQGSARDLQEDVWFELAKVYRAEKQAVKENEDRFEGQMSLYRPYYIAALRDYLRLKDESSLLFPDANSTLRISYGKIMGYQAPQNAEAYKPFSYLDELVSRVTNIEPFTQPDKIKTAEKHKIYGDYADANGRLPVNFLSDLHISNGNSGSATLNGKAELIGLAFDGNLEGLGADWKFIPELSRTIHVDIRYILWLMDTIYKADHLVREMGVEPSVQNQEAVISVPDRD